MSEQQQPEKPIKYGDVFPTIQGKLADEAIKPQDAAMMQSAENMVMGQVQKGGPASIMQSASDKNEQAGLVGHDDVSEVPAKEGVVVTETEMPFRRIITETVAGQVLGQYTMPEVAMPGLTTDDKITIGEALETAALTAGEKPVEKSDVAAIQAAEIRATGKNEILPGSVAAAAQAAASANARVMSDKHKTKLGDVLTDAKTKLPSDKVVTRSDAEKVMAAEVRNTPNVSNNPVGVAASVAGAARLNQDRQI